jgi:hypothetical protein
LAIVHAKYDSRGVVTGTVSVFDSRGSTQTAAASDLVGPDDWNAYHAEAVRISGSTAGATSSATAQNVVMGATGGLQIRQSTAAGGATQWVSRVEPADANMMEFEPISGSAILTNSSLGQNSLYLVPFYLNKGAYISRINFPVSIGTTVSAGNNSGTAGLTFSAALYSRMTAAGSNDRISSFWSCSLAYSAVRSSNTNINVTNVVGIANSSAVSTVATTHQTSNASTYIQNSVGGYRMWALPVNSSLTPGRYWLACAASTTAASAVARMGLKASVGMQTVGGAAQIAYQPVGTSSAASDASQNRIWQGAGTYSATSGGFPGSVPLTTDAIRAGLTLTLPYFNLSGYTTASSVL